MISNYESGHTAEKIAAKHLKKQGYDIIQLNWRHARAEIDIIARKKSRLRFVQGPLIFFEVKHRKTSNQGHGLDYITARKLAQMKFAAELYVTQIGYEGEYCLGAIELAGSQYEIETILENIT